MVLKPGHDVSPDALIGFVRDAEGPVMAPKSVMFVDSLPLTPLGKIDKKQLRAPFWSNQGRDVA